MSKRASVILWLLALIVVAVAGWSLATSQLSDRIEEREKEIEVLLKEVDDLRDQIAGVRDERLEAEEALARAKEELIAQREQYEVRVAELDDRVDRLRRERDRNRREYEELFAAISTEEPDELATGVELKLRDLDPAYATAEFVLLPEDVSPTGRLFRANRPAAEGTLFSLLKVEELTIENVTFEQEVGALTEKIGETEALLGATDRERVLCDDARGLCLEELALEKEVSDRLAKALGLSRDNVKDLDRKLRWGRARRILQTLGGVAAGYFVGSAVN